MNIRQETISYIKDGIFTVCRKFKNRTAGSKAELSCQLFFEKQLRAWADETRQHAYYLHPEAFYGWVTIAVVLNLLCVGLFWFRTIVPSTAIPAFGFVLSLLCISVFIFEFLLYREYIDFLFPRKQSINVYARRSSAGPAKKRIVFVGHADTACEFTFCLHGRGPAIAVVLIGSILGMLLVFGINAALLVETILRGPIPLEGIYRTAAVVQTCFVPFFIALLFFFNRKTVVDGANDNLSGSFVAMGVLKELADQNIRFADTEVCCLITGGEEVGLRGSFAFASDYKKLVPQETETVFVVLDTLREEKHLRCYLRGINGTQPNSEAVGNLLSAAAKQNGIDLSCAPFYPGATDAEAFSRNGLLACGLCAVNHDPQTYYHTRHDTYENIDLSCIKKVLDICMETVRIYARSGIGYFQNKAALSACPKPVPVTKVSRAADKPKTKLPG